MRERRRQTVLDVGLLVAVAVLLVAIHFLVPVGLQNQLAFNTERFAPWTLLTAAYVHNADPHLFSNLLGFGLGASISYALCRAQGRRQWFWMTTAAFLLVLPILVELTNYVAFQLLGAELTSRGFSGVVAGYGGFILVALARDIADRYGRDTGYYAGAAILLILLGEVAVIYTGVPSLEASALLLLGLSLTLGQLGRKGIQRDWAEDERRIVAIYTGFTTAVVGLLILFVGMLFPVTIAGGGSTTNIVGHGAGFILGIVVALTGIVVDERMLWRFCDAF